MVGKVARDPRVLERGYIEWCCLNIKNQTSVIPNYLEYEMYVYLMRLELF